MNELDTLTMVGGSLRVGDIITFSYVPSWRKRLWYAIRYMRHNNPLYQPSREFVVSWANSDDHYEISPSHTT